MLRIAHRLAIAGVRDGDEERAAGLEQAAHFGQRRQRIRGVLEHVLHRDDLEAVGLEGHVGQRAYLHIKALIAAKFDRRFIDLHAAGLEPQGAGRLQRIA
jgi:hypothetical protein